MADERIAGDANSGFELGAEDEAELAESIAEADRGDVVSAEELFRRFSR
jgi:2-polyprenyl-6-methoxyphenol hydroxylase-like FAD-dependent oxidoreductase